jgi:hypothetical protein
VVEHRTLKHCLLKGKWNLGFTKEKGKAMIERMPSRKKVVVPNYHESFWHQIV